MQGSWISLSQSNGKVEQPIAEEERSWIQVDETSKWKPNRRCEKRQGSWIPIYQINGRVEPPIAKEERS